MLNYGKDNEIYITNDDDYTHAIILNTGMPKLFIPKENVLGLACEPPHFLGLTQDFINYAEKYIGKYFIGLKGNLPAPFIEHYSYMWHCTPLTYIPVKTQKMSIIFSNKTQAPGHKYRHILINEILKTKLPIDIYGRGCTGYSMNDSRIKGPFTDDKIAYDSYKYHIAIENFETNDYISEKLTNALLYGCIPIYYGAKNCDKYFNNCKNETDSVSEPFDKSAVDIILKLTGNVSEDMQLLKRICEMPDTNDNKCIERMDVNKVKKQISLLHNIKRLF
jgi:hypothetical protein